MNLKFQPRWSRIEKTVNDVLVAATGCLAVLAVLLASLMFIQIEIASWRVGDASGGVPAKAGTRIDLS